MESTRGIQGEYKLMVTVLAQQVKDYFGGIKASQVVATDKKTRSRVQLMNRRAKAAREFFENQSNSYVFDFNFICIIIGLDPEKMRSRILNIKSVEDVNSIFEKLAEMNREGSNVQDTRD